MGDIKQTETIEWIPARWPSEPGEYLVTTDEEGLVLTRQAFYTSRQDKWLNDANENIEEFCTILAHAKMPKGYKNDD